MIVIIDVLAGLGFIVTAYGLYVERKIKQQNYKPMCDLSDRISCTKPLTSAYAHLFYISNNIVGMLFYLVIFTLNAMNAYGSIFILSVGSLVVALFLAYHLFFRLKLFCLLCISVYIINLLLVVVSYMHAK